jgi:crotonobetainyl-CoA:carnitine CoA-transferase CaiB-like acyl-CoA transferase
MAGPLTGVRVLDLTRLIPGALCTRKLSDFGAEVVKIEQPGVGDHLRITPPFIAGESVYHLLLNRGKRSVALDLKTEDGRVTLRELAQVADVVVEVSGAKRLAARGLDLELLRRTRPELVVCSISGFGRTGPLADLPAHGLNMEALSATLPVDWQRGRPVLGDLRFSGGLGVELAGLNAAIGILAALVRARVDGVGAWLEMSCWDAAVESKRLSLALAIVRHSEGVHQPEPWSLGPLYDVYACQDGRVIQFCAIERKFWDAFCTGIDRPDLAERWNSESDYYLGDPELRDDLEEVFALRTADDWFTDFVKWSIPATPVLSMDDLFAHPHLQARHLVDPPIDDGVPNIADPVRFVETDERPGAHLPRPPAVGADTQEVFRGWLNREARS